MGGVTQGTYNRWRAKHGMGPADVCANLTREQAKAVYYELFWQPVGADRLPAAMALTVVDHYVNTGEYRDGLKQCGTDFECFNQWRVADYKTKSNYGLYGQAWINRVNRIRQAAKVAAWIL
jgi:lysozyme family protein